MLSLLFPPKCILCKKVLDNNETDLCHSCRADAPEFKRAKRNIPFIAHWTALWYYKDEVCGSIKRFKFGNRRGYSAAYARLLALHLQSSDPDTYDLLTWVPVSAIRRFTRGYDQSALLADALGRELDIPVVRTLRKIRHTPPQSSIRDAAKRRVNVLGAYKQVSCESIVGKRIILVDDVITTGATASECARVLLSAGAKEVFFAAVAATEYDKK